MELLKISEVHFSPIRPRAGLIGFVAFTINNAFSVSGVGVHARSSSKGIRLLYPSKKLHDGSNVNLVYPISRNVGEIVENAVCSIVEKVCPALLAQGGVDV